MLMMTIAERLELHSMPEPNTGCQIWLAAINTCGYGQLTVNDKTVRAHRLSWEERNGPIPHGAHVLHSCDNPACINPDHLFLGNHLQNMGDRNNKKRQAHGDRHGRAKISESDIPAIRASNKSQREIAAGFGVTRELIGQIKRRQIWAHVP